MRARGFTAALHWVYMPTVRRNCAADRTRSRARNRRYGGPRMNTRLVQLQESMMRKNDALAAALRARFSEAGTTVVNLLSSPGSGKTTMLEETLRRLAPE